MWIAQQALPISVALQPMWCVQAVQRVSTLLHSPQAARTVLQASTTQSDRRHRVRHAQTVDILQLPLHHVHSATQGRVMQTVIRPQPVQLVPLASMVRLDRMEQTTRAQVVYRVLWVSMMMTATLQLLASSVL